MCSEYILLESLLETRICFGRFLFVESYKDAGVGSEVGRGNENQGLGANVWNRKSLP